MNYDVYEAPSFWDSARAIRRDDDYKAALMDTLIELRQQPFRNPKLRTHDVGRGINGKKVFSSDVGGRRSDRRLVWQIFDKTIVVLLYGTHAVQERAKRMKVAFDPAERVVSIYERAPDTGVERPYLAQRQEIGTLFMAWTDAELADLGFNEPTVKILRGLDTDEQLLALEDRLDGETFERAFNLVAYGNVQGKTTEPGPVEEADEPEVTDEDREIARQLEDVRAGGWFTQTEPAFLAEVLTRPIEDWMIFLHPDQRATVTRHYQGPARVRGAAGTGKTVVGLHRAAWLAKRNRENGVDRPVLFTTFIKSLPPVFESLYARMPDTREGEVEFVHLDRLARLVCAEAGDDVRTIPPDINAAFNEACKKTLTTGSPLVTANLGRQYLRDEITSVIKGRGLTSLDIYLEVARTGRQAPMARAQREQVWDLMLAWDEAMAARGTIDFVDAVIRARDHARRLQAPWYSAVIVDEAQDLSLVGLQLVRALVNAPGGQDVPNGLMLLGDGAQRIYAGGFKLRQAGVEVRGRTTVLQTNYRNTREIIGTALAVAGDSDVDDLGEAFRRGDAIAEASRQGAKPLLVRAADLDGQLDELVRQMNELTATDRIGPGDVAVLVPTNWMVERVMRHLEQPGAGFKTQSLAQYDGQPNDMVKVGTYHRGKGLEFKAVFLPGLSRDTFPRQPQEGLSPEEAAEARELEISALFVAMTRARDVLVVLYDGKPSEVLAGRKDRFDHLEVV